MWLHLGKDYCSLPNLLEPGYHLVSNATPSLLCKFLRLPESWTEDIAPYCTKIRVNPLRSLKTEGERVEKLTPTKTLSSSASKSCTDMYKTEAWDAYHSHGLFTSDLLIVEFLKVLSEKSPCRHLECCKLSCSSLCDTGMKTINNTSVEVTLTMRDRKSVV